MHSSIVKIIFYVREERQECSIILGDVVFRQMKPFSAVFYQLKCFSAHYLFNFLMAKQFNKSFSTFLVAESCLSKNNVERTLSSHEI